jgi:hypothetical protein
MSCYSIREETLTLELAVSMPSRDAFPSFLSSSVCILLSPDDGPDADWLLS